MEQGHRLHRLVVEHGLEILDQREAGTFDPGRCLFVTGVGLLHEALKRGFHATQHLRRRAQADDFERSHVLVQLLTRHAQRSRIDRLQIAVARLLVLTHESPNGLVGRIERFAQLFENPGERPEIGVGQVLEGGFGRFGHGDP